MNLKTCPDRDSLQQLLLGKTPRPQAEPLEEHLLHCDQCSAMADKISASDELTAAIQAPDLAYGEEEIVAQVIQRGKQLRSQAETSEIGETLFGNDSPRPENVSDASAASPQTNLDEEIDFLAPAELTDEIGRLGDYRVLEVLGVGGMGVVFRAEDPKLKREVALKAMKPAVAASRSAKDRFLREARATASIEHDNIVNIHQVGEDRGVPFIAMQFLRGESLQQCLKREKKLDQRDVLRIGREVAAGLDAAHERGLIHRDIKPDNIWLEHKTPLPPGEDGSRSEPGEGLPHTSKKTRSTSNHQSATQKLSPQSSPGGRGSFHRAKILDFGLVRAATDDAGLTQTGVVLVPYPICIDG